ncbi:MAG TPA: BtpA/SgcQ family protein [Candidatus Bipolaricaulis sp.]|nr:BtpA/SgcQ family protein [Candidatus Bipolaricaulis sp.]MDY0392608.1 BtpA/SgcQ family protein [Candidatus Bipolaricaulis sp.]HPD07265.1 BtpA/SgcQ family protein [Candidatus Bipolaricaulis sp.]HRS13955.1 BtpA/SgcQ family protein [Candidatus Bipolaricaulis sp.]HRU22203.1 BtpA/SgcQ family protein [Candidatus Bipolaricaulis sp.]
MSAEWKERWDGLRITSLGDLFGVEVPVIGMVHLWPLPGAPGYTGYGMEKIVAAALSDARALVRGGVDGLIVENMWDLPYHVGRAVPPEESACHAVAARAVVEEVSVPVGINVVHNGGVVALAIAVACGAAFIRVCLLTGAQVWDTGEFDHGCAAELLRKRKELGAEHIKLLCDVDKKHAVRFPGIDLATHIAWTEFYGADALIISGRMTGDAPAGEKVRAAKELAHRPILVGSGATEENIGHFLQWADGVIVGSSLKRGGEPTAPVDEERVVRFVAAARSGRG